MRSPSLFISFAALPLLVSAAAALAPARSPVPAVEVAGHRVVVDSITEWVLMARGLAGNPPASTTANQHHATIKLRVTSPSPAAATAVDGFVGEFRAETDRGNSLSIPNEGTTWMAGDATLFTTIEEMDPRVRTLKRLSGKVRFYPHGEAVEVRVAAQEGAEAHQPSGLGVRVSRFVTAGEQAKLELVVDWPASVSMRDETDDDAPLRLMGDLGGANGTMQIRPAEEKMAPAGGRKRFRVTAQLTGLRGPLRALIVQGVARTGTPLVRPFTLANVVLPYTLAMRPAQPAATGLEALQQVLVNGRPAGLGTLEVGIASRRGDGWGPVRWERLTTDTQGRASFTFPAPGRFRVLRRWRPSDAAYARSLEKTRWQGADLDLTIATGKLPRLAALAAAAAPEPAPAAGTRYETMTRGYRVRAVSVQERAQPIVSYELDPTRVWVRGSRLVTLTVEVAAPNAEARAALAAAAVSGAVGPDGRAAPAYDPEYDGQGEVVAGLAMQFPATFGRLNPEWKLLATVDGELSIFPRARIATLEIPLAALAAPDGPPLDFESGDVRLRAQRIGSRALPSYRVEITGPGDAAVLPASEGGVAPALLDAQKRPVQAPVRGPARSLKSSTDRPIGVAITFADPEGTPAFLRLPVVFRYGKPETHGFRLTDIPLPLSEGG